MIDETGNVIRILLLVVVALLVGWLAITVAHTWYVDTHCTTVLATQVCR